MGPPPRVRGKVRSGSRCWRQRRITPACAGKRWLITDTCPAKADHPRVCGEKTSTSPSSSLDKGSPPRVRGKAHAAVLHGGEIRITPAYAGKRAATAHPAAAHRDHPRVCGEKCFSEEHPQIRLGSPPRVRGKVSLLAHALRVGGITPACAGKRPKAASISAATLDHPRVCGEKTLRGCERRQLDGSPPRVRGKGRDSY